MILLDTNTIIHVLRGNPKVGERFRSCAGEIAVPAMVLGELLFGVAKSDNPQKNGSLLKTIMDALPVLHTNNQIMEIFAMQKAALSRRGEPVGDADTLSAATALAYDATLVTGNMRHFTRFEGLRIEDWTA